MRYYKIEKDGFITSIGTGNGGIEISEDEYNAIKAVLAVKPHDTLKLGHKLKTDLTWLEFPQDLDPGPLSGDEKLAKIRAKIKDLKDKATLQTTKAIYQAILDLFDEE